MTDTKGDIYVAGQPERPKRILGMKFLEALRDAGIISEGDYISRVVIDAGVRDAVKVYVERYGDDRLLQVATSLEGIEISTVPKDGISFERAKELIAFFQGVMSRAEAKTQAGDA